MGFVHQVRLAPAPAFLTLQFAPGECAEVNWAQAGYAPVGKHGRALRRPRKRLDITFRSFRERQPEAAIADGAGQETVPSERDNGAVAEGQARVGSRPGTTVVPAESDTLSQPHSEAVTRNVPALPMATSAPSGLAARWRPPLQGCVRKNQFFSGKPWPIQAHERPPS